MWRRVSCEQPLHTSQSILSPRGNPMLMVGSAQERHILFSNRRYGPPSGERECCSYSATQYRHRYAGSHTCRGDANNPGEAGESCQKSYLFCISTRCPWNHFAWR